MANYTENLNLIKPEAEDVFTIDDFNENMDTLDTSLASAEAELEGISEKIGTPATEGQTLFSLLSAGGSAVKSIQRFSQTCDANAGDITIPLSQHVNTNKSLLLIQHMFFRNESMKYNATLYTDKIVMNIETNGFDPPILFQVIEFY